MHHARRQRLEQGHSQQAGALAVEMVSAGVIAASERNPRPGNNYCLQVGAACDGSAAHDGHGAYWWGVGGRRPHLVSWRITSIGAIVDAIADAIASQMMMDLSAARRVSNSYGKEER